MKIIEVRPCKKFKGAWVAFEALGVEPAFAEPDATHWTLVPPVRRTVRPAPQLPPTLSRARETHRRLD